MKKILVLVTAISSFLGFSQNLEQHIPATATAVIQVKGGNLTQLVSAEAFSNFLPGREMLKDFNRKRTADQKIKSVADLGFDLKSDAYYFFESNDSISYHTFIVKLNNKKQFESLQSEYFMKDVQKEGNISYKIGWNDVTLWNDSMLIAVNTNVNSEYIDAHKSNYTDDEDVSAYQLKKALAKQLGKTFGLKTFNKAARTITSNGSYTSGKDNAAAAYIWLDNYGSIIKNSLESLRYFMPRNLRKFSNMQSDFGGLTTVKTALYFDTDAIRIKNTMKIADSWKATYNKIYKSKIDKRFFKYFDKNKALAYMSASVDSKALLDAYPKIITSTYGGALPAYQEEVSLGSELISLFLDEEAIGDLITGDMLFVLNDITEKEVPYTTYVYDEEYNSKEVTKTKKEISPEFTFIIGSENKSIISKFLRLGVKHHVVTQQANFYKFKTPEDLPFETYAIVKDGMLILTSSASQMAKIATGLFKANAGKHKKMMRKNNTVLYANPSAIVSKIGFGKNEKDLKMKKYLEDNLVGTFKLTSKIAGNQFITNAKMDTKGDKKNALNYIFTMIDDIAEIYDTPRNESAAVVEESVREEGEVVEEIVQPTEAEDVEVMESTEVEETVMEATEKEEVEEATIDRVKGQVSPVKTKKKTKKVKPEPKAAVDAAREKK